MVNEVVTLYIDDISLRLLVAGRSGIKKWAEMSLEPGLVKDGAIVDEAAVASAIKTLLNTEKVSARKVITGLSGRHCLSRLITLPQLPKSLIGEAVRREAERLLPVPLKDFYLSWQTIPGKGEEMQVFLIAFPQNATDALTRTLRQAGLDPYLIGIKPLALARVGDKATAIVADAQPNELDIIVLVDRIPQLIRTVSLPGEAQSRQKKMAVVKEELDRTIKFYNSSHEDKPLAPDIPIYVSGELVKESETGVTLASGLKTFAEPLLSPLKYHRALPPSRYMVNVGLALKKVSPSRKWVGGSVVNLNAVPQVHEPKHRSLAEMLFVPGVVVALAALTFPIMSVKNAAAGTAQLQNELDVTNQRFKQAQLQKKTITELEGKVAALEKTSEGFNKALSHFEQDHEKINNDLTTVTSGLTSSLELSNVFHSSERLTVGGIAPDETLILEYARRLRASERFSRVIISSIERTGDGLKFELTLFK